MAKREAPEDAPDLMSSLRERLKIDKHALDEELVEQPQLFYHAAQQYVLASSRRDAAYDEIKLTEAALNEEVRRELLKLNDKVTEAMVNSSVISHPMRVKAIEDHLAAKKEADEWSALKEAFGQRAYMLRDLVQLFVANYFATSSVSTDNPKRGEIVANAARARIDEVRKRKQKEE